MAIEAIKYLGIPKETIPTVNHSGQVSIKRPEVLEIDGTMPNLIGFSKKELLPLFKLNDIKIELRGEGWVFKQFPQPGINLEKGMTIILELQ